MGIPQEVIVVASALQQAFETESTAGNTVQNGNNRGQIHLIGFWDIQRVAANIWKQLSAHLDHEKAQLKATEESLLAKIRAEAAKVEGEVKAVVAKVEDEAKSLL